MTQFNHVIWWLVGGCTLFHFLWVGGLLGVVALAIRMLLPGESFHARYRLSVVFFILLLGLAPVLSWRIWTQIERPAATSVAEADDEALPDGLGVSNLQAAANNPVSAPHITRHSPSGWATLSVRVLTRMCPWLMAGWLLGSAWMLISLGRGVMHSIGMRRRAELWKSGPVANQCREMASNLGIASVPVGVSAEIESPILAGILHPTILLPQSLSDAWTPRELELVLLHELSHVRRRDNAINFIQGLAESVLFFQPAVWLVSRWIRTDREECCDDLVVRQTGRALEYAEILTQLARRHRPGRLAVAMGEHHLVGRVRRILAHSPRNPARSGRVLLLTATSLFSIIALATALQAQLFLPDRSALDAAQKALTPHPEAPPVDGDGILLYVVDESGAPASAARLRLRAQAKQYQIDPDKCPADLIADSVGVIHFHNRGLLAKAPSCDPRVAMYIRDASGRLAAGVNLQVADWGKSFHLTLQPVCRVSLTLTSTALANAGRSLSMSKAMISLPENTEAQRLLGLTGDSNGQVRGSLPPGRYKVFCFGGSPGLIETGIVAQSFEVPPGMLELDLGRIDLPLAKKTRPWGKAESSQDSSPSVNQPAEQQPNAGWAGSHDTGFEGKE